MADKHTPGPWTIDQSYNWMVYSEDGKGVANSLGTSRTGEEMRGNACLISAAPDLLRDFEEATRALCGFTCLHRFEKASHTLLCQEYSATIAKAKGGKG